MTSASHDSSLRMVSSRTTGDEAGLSMRTLAYFVGAFLAALILGIGSAWYMIDRGSPLTTTKVGPWEGWIDEGNPNADHYTRAHVARSGRLPLTSTVARYFIARKDSTGAALSSNCEYIVVGAPLDAPWWSLTLYDQYGGLIANPSSRYSFNSEELLRHSDGSFRINLARNARPENWLPTGPADQRLVLMLRVYGPRETDVSGTGLVPHQRLPKIERKACE